MYRDEKGSKRYELEITIGVKYKDLMDNVMREIEIMKKLNHPNVMKLTEVIDSEECDKMFIGKIEQNS